MVSSRPPGGLQGDHVSKDQKNPKQNTPIRLYDKNSQVEAESFHAPWDSLIPQQDLTLKDLFSVAGKVEIMLSSDYCVK